MDQTNLSRDRDWAIAKNLAYISLPCDLVIIMPSKYFNSHLIADAGQFSERSIQSMLTAMDKMDREHGFEILPHEIHIATADIADVLFAASTREERKRISQFALTSGDLIYVNRAQAANAATDLEKKYTAVPVLDAPRANPGTYKAHTP